MPSKPTTVEQYLATLPEDRRDALQAVRRVILDNLDDSYAEGMQYGMIGYSVPHSVYPAGYHCDPKQPLPYVSLGSQKNHMAVYLCGIYMSEDLQRWFVDAWTKTGKRLDMGKSCVRFKKIDDVPLDVIGKLIKRTPAKKFVAMYESSLEQTRSAKRTAKKKATTKKVARKTKKKTAKKVTRKTSPRPR
jgi:hypothetical protein